MKLKTILALAATTIGVGAFAADPYTTTGYEAFGDTAGVVLWRGEGSTFHNDKVIDVAADGTSGDAYAMDADKGATSWQRFCIGQTAYSAPGKVLVYDVTGKAASSDAQFQRISFGGLWVKALADETEGTPYSIEGNSGIRNTDFGYSSYTTYFKFDKSFTVNRASATRCYGNVNVSVADGATFTSVAAMWIENDSTLSFAGEGDVVLSNGLRMNTSSTLDLSAATRPTITGNVTFPVGATLVVPAGTEPTTETPFTVCSGTLTVSGDIYVKVGDAEAALATVTVDGSAITGFEFPTTEATFDGTTDWPTTVPVGYTYTFVGGETAEAAVAVPTGVAVGGTLKTTGYISLTDLQLNTGCTLEVVNGNTTAVAYFDGEDNIIRGNIIVRAGATLTTTQTDFLDWYGATDQTIDIYGTLAMGATRWSIKANSNCKVNLYPGAHVTGTGDGNGVFDLINANAKLNVYAGENGGEVVIDGVVKTRSANTPIWVAANTTLKVGGLRGGGVNKSGNGTLEISGTVANPGASTVSEGTVAFVDTTVAVPLTVNAGKTVTASASEGVTVPLNVTMNASANITVSGAGTVNGTVTFGAFPTGTLAGLTTSTWQGTVTVPAGSGNISKLANCGNANSVINFAGTSAGSYIMASGNTTYNVGAIVFNGDTVLDDGSSGSTVNFAKISGSGALTLSGWTGCSSARYNLNEVDGYSGTLTVANNITRDLGGTLTIGIGNIVTENTTPGACVLPIVNTAVENTTGTVVYNLDNAKLNGEAADLEVKDDGIYVAEPVVGTIVAYVDRLDAANGYTDFAAAITAATASGTHQLYVTTEQTLASLTVSADCVLSITDYNTAPAAFTLTAATVSGTLKLMNGSFDGTVVTLADADATCYVSRRITGTVSVGTSVTGKVLVTGSDTNGVTYSLEDVVSGSTIKVNGTAAEVTELSDGSLSVSVTVPFVYGGTVPTVESVVVTANGQTVTTGFNITDFTAVEHSGASGTSYDVSFTATLKAPFQDATVAWTPAEEGKVKLGVAVVPGLFYGVTQGATLSAAAGATPSMTLATDENKDTLLVVDEEDGDSGFYKVWVSDKE